MSQQPLSPVPLSTPVLAGSAFTRGWQIWLVAVQAIVAQLQTLALQFAGSLGVGNGAAAPVQAPAVGTGTGPANPLLVAGYAQVTINGMTAWVPYFE